MTDIVERLGRDLMEISYDDIEAMVREARAEIERLRSLLLECRPYTHNANNWDASLIFRIDAALEPEP